LDGDTVAEADTVVLSEAEVEPESDDVIVLVIKPDADELLDALDDIDDDGDGLVVVVE
jgi:hypothetical protein